MNLSAYNRSETDRLFVKLVYFCYANKLCFLMKDVDGSHAALFPMGLQASSRASHNAQGLSGRPLFSMEKGNTNKEESIDH